MVPWFEFVFQLVCGSQNEFVTAILYFQALGMLPHGIIGRRKMPITNLSSTRNGKDGCHEMTITNLGPITDRSGLGSETLDGLAKEMKI